MLQSEAYWGKFRSTWRLQGYTNYNEELSSVSLYGYTSDETMKTIELATDFSYLKELIIIYEQIQGCILD